MIWLEWNGQMELFFNVRNELERNMKNKII